MVWGDSKVGKTTLVERLTNSARSESDGSVRIVECAVSKNDMGITWYMLRRSFLPTSLPRMSLPSFCPKV